jgi:hypothetical protein
MVRTPAVSEAYYNAAFKSVLLVADVSSFKLHSFTISLETCPQNLCWYYPMLPLLMCASKCLKQICSAHVSAAVLTSSVSDFI